MNQNQIPVKDLVRYQKNVSGNRHDHPKSLAEQPEDGIFYADLRSLVFPFHTSYELTPSSQNPRGRNCNKLYVGEDMCETLGVLKQS